jgi:hypothetical protein
LIIDESVSIDCDELNKRINPCECLQSPKPHNFNIFCTGLKISDSVLDKFQSQKEVLNFRILYIQKTSLVNIKENTFENFTFEQIFIEDNKNLKSINSLTFGQLEVKYLVIRNNTQLNEEVFGLVEALSPNYTIELTGNGLKEITNDWFLGMNISAKYLDLSYNEISSLKNLSVFESFPNLQQLSLDHNNIKNIDGLNFFSPTDGSEHSIEVFLNDNKLNENSFKGLKSQSNVNVKLYLENNNFEKLEAKDFENFVNKSKNELYFGNNTFKCDCKMKWVLKYENSINNVWCVDTKFDQSIFRLNETQLLCK